jgi:predicted NBD/HSP70 family sugar kinase
LINGQLFQGDGGGAGEIGHVVVQENGELCRCGKRGCLETVASARAVVQQMKMDSLDDVISFFDWRFKSEILLLEKQGITLAHP